MATRPRTQQHDTSGTPQAGRLNGRLPLSALPYIPDWLFGYWREPFLELQPSDELVRHHVFELVWAIQRAGQRFDYAAMRRLLEIYEAGHLLCLQEPLLTAYELGLMHITTMTADLHLVQGDFDGCLADVAAVRSCLRAGDARRQALGLQARGNSQLRYACLGLVAACLRQRIKEDPALRTEALTVISDYWQVAEKVMHSLRTRTQSTNLTVSQTLSRWEIEIVKLAFTLDWPIFREAVSRFNKRFKADLSWEHMVTDPWIHPERSAWHWDLEVWKHVYSGSNMAEQLKFCKSQREYTMRFTYGVNAAVVLKRFWERQAA